MEEEREEVLLPFSSDQCLCNTGWSAFQLMESNGPKNRTPSSASPQVMPGMGNEPKVFKRQPITPTREV